MELPITKPSMVSYADQIDFNQLVGELAKNKHNGFIRVTYGSEDGYLLFKEGEQIAASYDTYSKLEALERILSVTENDRTLVEVFDIKKSQIDFLLDVNKHYIINLKSETDELLSELQSSRGYEEVDDNKEKTSSELDELPKSDELKTEAVEEPEIQFPSNESPDTNETSVTDTEVSEVKGVKEETSNTLDVLDSDPSISDASDNSIDNNPIEEELDDLKPETEVSKTSQLEEASEPEAPLDRSDLLKKYGIKEVKEEDVENLLDSYKGGSVDEGDVEKIELTLMNKIKKSVLGLPKIRGAEVMVFLDNINGLSGHVNVIIESESQGFLSKLRGESKDADNLKRQIINISQIEIRKSFRKYPEIVDEFDINVEMN